ncbi:MAG TPA: DUF4430 domain-containing protein [Thermoplasmata archaeon]|jgi:hypothetical protein|nr:DUF4430 domain-containing protein [Thermoplasmata archaeon]
MSDPRGRILRTERGRAVAFLAAWLVGLVLCWSVLSATLPRPVEGAGSLSATLRIDGGAWTISFTSHSTNNTVFHLLREASAVLDFDLDWVEYGWPYNDVFVTAINGTRNSGAANLWWQYCVNGAYSARGAGTQQVRTGDVVSWVYAAPGGDALCR